MSVFLLASDADFKVLACGMIWNDAARPGKVDHWGSYAHELDALYNFIGENDIDGVVLVGGDIQRSRVVRHDTRSSVGYDLVEFITSPMNGRVIGAADQPHPGLMYDIGEPNTFLVLTADSTATPTTLDVTFLNSAGKTLHHMRAKASALSRNRTATGRSPNMRDD